ncbi:MAG: hypothetical protein NTY39_05985 [Campylobacterales bacterium]|nr:hypothetical protein [Campylobacterales bacterium]
MNFKILQFVTLAFSTLVILQASLGALLFTRLVGFTPHDVNLYYGDKSLHGLLEVILPHTLFISIALMAVLHFLAFIQTIDSRTKKRAIYLLFTLFFLDQLSPLFITLGLEFFAVIKIIAFVGFQIALLWVWILIFRETLKLTK